MLVLFRVGVGFTWVERMRVLVPVLVAHGGGWKLFNCSFRVLEYQDEGLLCCNSLDHLNIGNLGKGDLHLSSHGFRVRNGLVYCELFYLVELDVFLDCTGANFIDFLHDDRGNFTNFHDPDKEGFFVLLIDKELLGHLDSCLTLDYPRDSISHELFTNQLFGSLSEHLNGLKNLFGLAAFAGFHYSAATVSAICS